MKQIDQFTVKQERGKNSTVTVYSDILRSWPEDKEILEFKTDQSLTSNSDRAWEVKEAIKKYASPLGYKLLEEHKNILQFVYDRQAHSSTATYQIQQEIAGDERYQNLFADCKEQQDAINKHYRTAISQLKNLTSKLEKANQAKIDELSKQLTNLEITIASEKPLPGHLSNFDTERLTEPKYPIKQVKTDNYYGQNDFDTIPDKLDWILALL